MSIPDGVLKYQELIRKLDEKIDILQAQNPTRNSQDSKNLWKLKMIKRESEIKYKYACQFQEPNNQLSSFFKTLFR